MKERTIRTVLEGFRKVELEDLGSLLGGPVRSRMRKEELVESLATYLAHKPQLWLENLQERDIRLLRQLVHAGADNVQLLDYADYPSILELVGLVDYDDSDSQYHKVWLRSEVYDIVAPHVEKAISSGEKSGRFQIERIGLGYLNLYGILPTDRFVDLLMDYYDIEHSSDYEGLTRILKNSSLVKSNRFTDEYGDYICSPLVMDAEEIFRMRSELMSEENYAPFTYEEALDAGSGAPFFTVGLKSEEGKELVKMLRRLGFDGFELIQTEYDIWMESQLPRDEHSLFEIVDMTEYQLHEPHTFDLFMKVLRNYANSIPRWALYGHSAEQCGVLKVEIPAFDPPYVPYDEGQPVWSMPRPTISEGYSDQIETDESLERLSALLPKGFPFGMAIPHVAPNDPCPCGSGLRYMHCHGKNMN